MCELKYIVYLVEFIYLFLIEGFYLYTNYSSDVIYENADTQKSFILEENMDRSGVYLWKNLINGKMYVGSSVNLRRRLLQYYNAEYLERNDSMRICPLACAIKVWLF